ncbi:platelet-activating factor acetylhydrolase 2, cytoplasmic-like protein [Sarcoptes scabiei]|uniref:1-alkyl-2-acetylglycerophosphocholine esterase n=1 Tax=Sarcoptes scabiei TaxID=52283 RepID=A0A132AJG6_SARSC|nr:platelet-activating factor acetylhydrolase 2, cytoplasmic-like protein [Sarcoptes scabiei]
MAKKIKLSSYRDRRLKTNDRNHVPLPTGPYQKIGCRDFMVGLSRKSGVLVRLYYPAKTETGSKKFEKSSQLNPLLWPNWLPHEFYLQGLADVASVRTNFFLSLINKTKRENVFIPVIPNARPHVLKNDKYPVIIFSHGLGGFRTSNSAICIELASNGFVVAALEHRDNTACLSFYPKRATYSLKSSNPDFFNISPDQIDADDEVDFGDEIDDPNYVPPKALAALTNIPYLELAWIRYRNVSISRMDEKVLAFRKKQINQRTRECTRALDLIEALNAGYEINNLLDPGYDSREFENQLDMDRLVMMGHSMGASTALMAGATELRFKIIIALSPWMFPLRNEAIDLIPQPILMVLSENLTKDDDYLETVQEWIGENRDDEFRKIVLIKGSNRLQQSDFPYVFKGFRYLKLLTWRNRIDSFDVHDLTNYLSMRFISKQLGSNLSFRID